MYLTEYPDPRDPYDYSVRAYDLDAQRFQHAPIVDPSEPDEPMTGIPLGRVMSPDGRWAYTLYGGGEETFVHALDTVGHTAVCVDLPQLENARSIYTLGLEPSGDDLIVLNREKPAALVDTETFEVTAPGVENASDAGTGDGAGLPWALAGGAFALTVAAGVLILRRRRRRLVTTAWDPAS
jgi:LPXTG-motif cell wall-anchored protein